MDLAKLSPRALYEVAKRNNVSLANIRKKSAEIANEATDTAVTVGSAFGWGFVKHAYPKVGQAKLFGTHFPLVPALAGGAVIAQLFDVGGKATTLLGTPSKGVLAGESYAYGSTIGSRKLRRDTIKANVARQAEGWYDPEDKVWFS